MVENPFDVPLQQAVQVQVIVAQTAVSDAEPAKSIKSPSISAPIGIRPQSISISKNKIPEHVYSEATINTTVSEPVNINRPYTPADFQNAWRKFELSLSDDKLIGFQNLNTPEMIQMNQFEVLVNNVVQDNQAKKLLSEAVQFIREELGNVSIVINTKVSEGSEGQRSLSPEQQYMEMVAKNPKLEQFRKLLSLEID